MEINKILSSDLLDIIFEGRNKDYGAYELRKTYNRRMAKAGMITLGLLSLLVTGYIFANRYSAGKTPDVIEGVVKLIEVPVVEPKVAVIIPPVKTEPPKVAMIKDLVPIIVPDKLADNDPPPTVDQLENSAIGPITSDGVKDVGIVAPPVANGEEKGIIVTPKVDTDIPFTKVEIESTYPGGASAWMRYLNKTFRYPGEAQEVNLQGTVTVQFIVDTDGNVSNVEAISGPATGGLREEAIRVIKKSGQWEPAIQNGRKVKSYKKQPISFKLETE